MGHKNHQLQLGLHGNVGMAVIPPAGEGLQQDMHDVHNFPHHLHSMHHFRPILVFSDFGLEQMCAIC